MVPDRILDSGVGVNTPTPDVSPRIPGTESSIERSSSLEISLFRFEYSCAYTCVASHLRDDARGSLGTSIPRVHLELGRSGWVGHTSWFQGVGSVSVLSRTLYRAEGHMWMKGARVGGVRPVRRYFFCVGR